MGYMGNMVLTLQREKGVVLWHLLRHRSLSVVSTKFLLVTLGVQIFPNNEASLQAKVVCTVRSCRPVSTLFMYVDANSRWPE